MIHIQSNIQPGKIQNQKPGTSHAYIKHQSSQKPYECNKHSISPHNEKHLTHYNHNMQHINNTHTHYQHNHQNENLVEVFLLHNLSPMYHIPTENYLINEINNPRNQDVCYKYY